MTYNQVRFILDTDTITYQQSGNPAVVHQLAQLGVDQAAATIVTMYEQLRGRLAEVNRNTQDEAALQVAYQRLQETHDYYTRILVLPFSDMAARGYQSLRQQRIQGRPGPQDLQIAAIALAFQATLVTHNLRHFSGIPELTTADWIG